MDEVIRSYPDVEITLFALALIKASIFFWEKPKIKKAIRNYFSNNDEDSWEPKTWHRITQKVLDLVDNVGLPPKLLPDFKDAILNTGVKMYDWICYCHSELGLDLSYSENIVWTPLGFVDEVKIFQSLWKNDERLYVDDKKIFRIACLFTQEDFIQQHQNQMLRMLKKLQMKANYKHIELEVNNYSDKVYGIISTYLAHYIDRNWNKRRKENYYDLSFYKSSEEVQRMIDAWFSDDQSELSEHLKQIVNNGTIASPQIMVKLCTLCTLTHGTRYYHKKLSDSQKENINDWIWNYYRLKLPFLNPNHYIAGKMREMKAFMNYIDPHWDVEKSPSSVLLFLCPLKHVIRPIFDNYLNKRENSGVKFIGLYLSSVMDNDDASGLPIKKDFFRNLLMKGVDKAMNSKLLDTKKDVMKILISVCIDDEDFLTLKTFVNRCEFDFTDYQSYLLYIDDCLKERLRKNKISSMKYFELKKKFHHDMFDSDLGRVSFFKERFCKSEFLRESDFKSWKELYYFVNVLKPPLRDTIDPLNCLSFIAEKTYFENLLKNCDTFIKWWHKSKKKQANLKRRFKLSSYPSECFYRFWINDRFSIFGRPVPLSDQFLKYLFGKSESSVVNFKTERISVLGLLDASFYNQAVNIHHLILCRFYNRFHEIIDDFITYFGISPEIINNVKEEIRKNIEEIMVNNFTVRNILTLNFLMDWVSLSEEDKMKIFRVLNDSSKMLKLCEEILTAYGSFEEQLDIFYNNWVRLYCNISELKKSLISLYEDERSESLILDLRSMYEKLEQGNRLSSEDFIKNFWD